jgi:hypothetical protein
LYYELDAAHLTQEQINTLGYSAKDLSQWEIREYGQTEPISSYLFVISAGPFAHAISDIKVNDQPMRIFVPNVRFFLLIKIALSQIFGSSQR